MLNRSGIKLHSSPMGAVTKRVAQQDTANVASGPGCSCDHHSDMPKDEQFSG